MKFSFEMASIVLFLAPLAFGGEGQSDIKPALDGIRSTEPAAVQGSLKALRNAGPAGLKALLRLYDQTSDSELLFAIDAVAGQRGAIWSRLFWYTDLAQAEAAAREQGKPIL